MLVLQRPLKVFAYSGRENGLMVVGSYDAMKELGDKLGHALASQPDQPNSEWPPGLVCTVLARGPYKDSKHWELSFHVAGTVEPEAKVTLYNRHLPPAISLSLLALAVIGLISLAQWVANGF